jgi:hypothetical protein
MQFLNKLFISLLPLFFLMNHVCAFQNEVNILKPIRTEPIGHYVGKLGEQWQFPSDHLPIGIGYDDLSILSWNILDTDYISAISYKNAKGLRGSLILEKNYYYQSPSITERDLLVIDFLMIMMTNERPIDLFFIQECNPLVFSEINNRLPKNFSCLFQQGLLMIINKDKIEVTCNDVSEQIGAPNIQSVWIKNKKTTKEVQLLNVATKQQDVLFAFLQKLDASLQKDYIITGDMPLDEIDIRQYLSDFPSLSMSIVSPYCTSIAPNIFESIASNYFLLTSNHETKILNLCLIYPDLAKFIDMINP